MVVCEPPPPLEARVIEVAPPPPLEARVIEVAPPPPLDARVIEVAPPLNVKTRPRKKRQGRHERGQKQKRDEVLFFITNTCVHIH